jgi:PAS domain-containing protein
MVAAAGVVAQKRHQLTAAAAPGRRLLGRRFGEFLAEADHAVFTSFLHWVFLRLSPAAGPIEIGPSLENSSQGKAPPACELTLVAQGQAPRVVRFTAVQAPPGQVCHPIAVDITERKRLEEQTSRRQRVFQSSKLALARDDPATDVIEVSTACARLLGYTREQLTVKYDYQAILRALRATTL